MVQVDTNNPKVRRMLLYFSPLISKYFWPASTLLRGHIALAILSLLETDLKFWRIKWANHSKRWILVSSVSMTYHGYSELNTSDWLQYVWALPLNRCRQSGSIFWDTQPNCRVIFNIVTAILSQLFLDLVLGCSSTWRCAWKHFFTISVSILGHAEQAFWRCHFSQNGLVQVPWR